MRKIKFFTRALPALALAGFLSAGCQPARQQTSASPAKPPPVAAMASATDTLTLKPPVRIDAGSAAPFTDSGGSTWLPDQGFEGGDVVDRGSDLAIAGTKDPDIYRTEHYSMNFFSCKLPDGKYIVKLHFAETFEEITGPGQRVFSFNVNGRDFQNFDVWVKAGGGQRACVETVNVNVTDETLKIIFTPGVENPEINGIEILPAS